MPTVPSPPHLPPNPACLTIGNGNLKPIVMQTWLLKTCQHYCNFDTHQAVYATGTQVA